MYVGASVNHSRLIPLDKSAQSVRILFKGSLNLLNKLTRLQIDIMKTAFLATALVASVSAQYRTSSRYSSDDSFRNPNRGFSSFGGFGDYGNQFGNTFGNMGGYTNFGDYFGRQSYYQPPPPKEEKAPPKPKPFVPKIPDMPTFGEYEADKALDWDAFATCELSLLDGTPVGDIKMMQLPGEHIKLKAELLENLMGDTEYELRIHELGNTCEGCTKIGEVFNPLAPSAKEIAAYGYFSQFGHWVQLDVDSDGTGEIDTFETDSMGQVEDFRMAELEQNLAGDD